MFWKYILNFLFTKKAEQPVDMEYLKAVENSMNEWFSDSDNEAFNDW